MKIFQASRKFNKLLATFAEKGHPWDKVTLKDWRPIDKDHLGHLDIGKEYILKHGLPFQVVNQNI